MFWKVFFWWVKNWTGPPIALPALRNSAPPLRKLPSERLDIVVYYGRPFFRLWLPRRIFKVCVFSVMLFVLISARKLWTFSSIFVSFNMENLMSNGKIQKSNSRVFFLPKRNFRCKISTDKLHFIKSRQYLNLISDLASKGVSIVQGYHLFVCEKCFLDMLILNAVEYFRTY